MVFSVSLVSFVSFVIRSCRSHLPNRWKPSSTKWPIWNRSSVTLILPNAVPAIPPFVTPSRTCFGSTPKPENSPNFLHSPASDLRAAIPPTLIVPSSFGRYRIVRRLGEGGMGTVYEAEQDDPRRTVALKIMRPGFDSLELRKRFTQEVQILGRRHHVGIAQVYDAGTSDDGRLYFAMEFIRGLPLHDYARHQTRSQAYQARLAAAIAALSSNDVADAARQLERRRKTYAVGSGATCTAASTIAPP